MSSNRSTRKHQSEKSRKGGSDSTVRLSSQGPPSSVGSRHSNSLRIKYEPPLTSSDGETQPEGPDKSRPKSSKPQRRDSAGQKPPSPTHSRRVKSSKEGHHQRTLIDEKTREEEQFRKSSHASMHSDDEETDLKSASPRPPRKNKSKTSSSAARPKSCHSSAQGQGRRKGYISPYTDSNRQPHAHQLDLRKGNNYYLYCLAKIYDITDMKLQKEMQYRNLLARQRQLGFHSPKECEAYTRYLSRPRTAEYSTAYSGQQRTKSTDARRQEESDRKSRTSSAADDNRRTGAANREKDQKGLCGDRKSSAVSSKRRPDSSKPRPVSSKGGQREVKNQRDVSRDDDDDEEEINRGRKERTFEDSESSQHEEEIENIQKTKNKHISQSSEDQRTKEDKGQSSVSLTSNAADAGDGSDEDKTSDGDESDRRISIPHSPGNSRREVATNSTRRHAEETSSNDSDRDIDGNRNGNIFTDVNSQGKTASQKAN